MKGNKVLDGLFGVCVGDALGLPVQFAPRSERKKKPVADMTGYGVFNMPPGTWSDDSSLTFCLAESLCHGYDLDDIADQFQKWLYKGHWTPFGQAFDIGNSTGRSIRRLKNGVSSTNSGDSDEKSNGNGSLMRILPLVYFLEDAELDERFTITHKVSSITHAHPRSKIACGIYVAMAINILKGESLSSSYTNIKKTVKDYYTSDPYKAELNHFQRILNGDISLLAEAEIGSSGYVVHTLEASIWCLLNFETYRDTVLAAVNLGEDTDTTAAVAGGLAGIYYGFDGIPKEWVDVITKKEKIIDLANRLHNQIYGG